jgi:hypothetical protein
MQPDMEVMQGDLRRETRLKATESMGPFEQQGANPYFEP